MKNLLIIIILLIASLFAKAQTECTTSSEFTNSAFAFPTASYINEGPYMVRLYYHIIRNTDGSGGQTLSEMYRSLDTLNSHFNPHNICLTLSGYNEILNSANYYMSVININTDTFFLNNNVANAINIYLAPKENNTLGGQANGIPGTHMTIPGYALGSPTSSVNLVSHELGHTLGLFHTHHGTCGCEGGSSCYELVNGSNAVLCGDYVSDTPADPKNSPYDYLTCTSTNTSLRDANNDLYVPFINNIMSYYYNKCLHHFTPNQGQRMRDFLLNNSYLNNCTIPSTFLVQNQNYSSGMKNFQSINSIVAGNNVMIGVTGINNYTNTSQTNYRAKNFITLEDGNTIAPDIAGYYVAEIADNVCISQNINNARMSSIAYQPMLKKSTWKYIEQGLDDYGAKKISYVMDTTIAGLIWQQYDIYYSPIWGIGYFDTSLVYNYFNAEYYREDTVNKKVFKLDIATGQSLLLYDFTLSLGQFYLSYLTGDTLYAIDTFSVIDESGFLHNGLLFSPTLGLGSYPFIYFIAEGLGVVKKTDEFNVFVNKLNCMVQEGQSIYFNDVFPQYNVHLNCDEVMTGIEADEYNSYYFSLYPNPVSDILYFSTNQQINKIDIFSSQNILIGSFLPNEKIELNKVSGGIYFVKTYYSNGTTTINKIIKL